jgi:hypothetical protein
VTGYVWKIGFWERLVRGANANEPCKKCIGRLIFPSHSPRGLNVLMLGQRKIGLPNVPELFSARLSCHW